MCNPIALILTEDTILTPPRDAWNHSHRAMFEAAGIPPSKSGEKYALVEVRAPNDVWRDPATNAVLPVNDDWPVTFGGDREPQWWTADKPAQEARARGAARRWLSAFPENIVPGAIVVSGYEGTSTSGYEGTSTSGDEGTSTSGYEGTSTSGYRGTSTSGYKGTSTSGDGGIVIVAWFDGVRRRLAVGYVGEDGILPNTPYKVVDGKLVAALEAAQPKEQA